MLGPAASAQVPESCLSLKPYGGGRCCGSGLIKRVVSCRSRVRQDADLAPTVTYPRIRPDLQGSTQDLRRFLPPAQEIVLPALI